MNFRRITQKPQNDAAIVRLLNPAEDERGLVEAAQEIEQLILFQNIGMLLLDLRGIGTPTSQFLGILLRAAEQQHQRGRRFVVCVPADTNVFFAKIPCQLTETLEFVDAIA